MTRYYEPEHFSAYAEIRARGLEQWSELHEPVAGFDRFPNRAFLQRALPPVTSDDHVTVLEYGCGTGPAACFLAQRGYRVHGVDLVRDAIDLARSNADERGLDIRFDVQDICRWDEAEETYDVVLDSYCLQSIVLDADRHRVLTGVRRRLAEGGRYVLSTAMYDAGRDYADARYDAATGIVWTRTAEPHLDGRRIDGAWHLPHRRHLTARALRAELEDHGFRVVDQSADGGDVVAEPSGLL